jgi:hypothetical protein
MTTTRIPKLTVPGTTTRAFTWNPTVGSYIVALFQQRKLAGVRKMRWVIDRPTATWRVQVAATPAGHAAVEAAVQAMRAVYANGPAHLPFDPTTEDAARLAVAMRWDA